MSIHTSAPDTASSGRRRTRLRLAAVVAVVLAAIVVLGLSGLDNGLVFYQSPTELTDGDANPTGQRVRLGGQVVPGSVHSRGETLSFTLTDGTTEIDVTYRGRPVGAFRPGQGALVEGALGTDGVFRGDRLMVKHSETYTSEDGQPYRPPSSTGEGDR